LLEIELMVAGCQFAVPRFVENSSSIPLDGYDQETTALVLSRAMARGALLMGSA